MTLRKKTLIIIAVVLTGLIGGLYATSSTILLGSLEKVEQEDTRQIAKGVLSAFTQDQEDFNSRFADWSIWDETYAFVKDANQEYIKSNLNPDTLVSLKVNLVLFVQPSGRITYGTGFDPVHRTKTAIPEVLRANLSPQNLLLQHSNPASTLAGIVLLPEGPMMISSRPILNNEGKGPIRGTLIFGRLLDADQIARLSRISRLPLTMHALNKTQLPPDFQAVRSSLSEKELILVRSLSKQTVAGYVLVKDIYGKSALLVRVDIPRTIYKQGQVSRRYLIWSLLTVGLAFGGVTLLLLEKLVLSRLAHLSAEVRSVGASSDLSLRVLMTGRDELSRLASTINSMLAALEHSQHEQRESEQRLRRQSRILVELARRKTLNRGDLNTALKEITEAAACTLEVERTSVWLYNDEHSKIHCIDLYERSTDRHSKGIELTAVNYPVYFQALEQERTISAHDAHTDPRTQEFSEFYLSPLSITSMLDAPIWLDGQMVGIICHEQVGPARQWALEEENFAGSIADLVSLTMEACERRRAEEALQQAEEQYRSIFENATEGIFQTTPDGCYVRANPALARIYGYELPEELIKSLTNVAQQLYVEPKRRAEFLRLMQEHDAVSEFESQIYRKDGNITWISENARAVYDASGALSCYEGSVEDITERKRAQEQLLHNALHDALTSLPNRALFQDRLEQTVLWAKRDENYLFAVFFLDLDRFKVVNDSLGHLIGDQLLIAIARRLEVCLRAGDTIARLGGDEFAILLNDIQDVKEATYIAGRIKQELALPFHLSGHEVLTSASIGIVLGNNVDGWLDDLLRNADIAMYQAKANGKARYEVFDTTMSNKAGTRLQLESELRLAIECQEFRVHYQPIVLLATGKIVGFEALVRWQHPTHGLISPVEFIPVAEETGLIVPIGQWVLQEACRQMHAWQFRFPTSPSLTISVNLSAKQFTQPDLPEQIARTLHETKLDARSLGLEITESLLLDNAESVTTVLLQLKALGISLYLDDFGTGYSSLSYLHRFPVDTLKIDRSFVSRMGFGDENSAIVRAITMMAQALGMEVIAEGIETAEQLIQLSALQCKYGQGYLFSKPLDAQTAGALIAQKLGGVDKSYLAAEYLDIEDMG